MGQNSYRTPDLFPGLHALTDYKSPASPPLHSRLPLHNAGVIRLPHQEFPFLPLASCIVHISSLLVPYFLRLALLFTRHFLPSMSLRHSLFPQYALLL